MAKTRANRERDNEEETVPEVQKAKTKKKRTPKEKEAKRRRKQQKVEGQEIVEEEPVNVTGTERVQNPEEEPIALETVQEENIEKNQETETDGGRDEQTVVVPEEGNEQEPVQEA
ncbi:MAG: hypothetical protein Q8754_02705, partial [Sweet potato little leaf phytoplasma]|nr:hypothetical protein [Sweet potato little leaf phytoplasma]